MTTVRRAYINPEYNQMVDDGCLEYKSIPIPIVNDILKITHSTNEYDGIKQIYNLVPPRPHSIHDMAVSIARINGIPYSSGVPEIVKVFVDDEKISAKKFVGTQAGAMMSNMGTQAGAGASLTSSTGTQMEPGSIHSTSMRPDLDKNLADLQKRFDEAVAMDTARSRPSVSLILGDEPVSSGVVPFNPSIESQTEWVMGKNVSGFTTKRTIDFMTGQSGVVRDTFGGGVSTQTDISKPSSNKRMSMESQREVQSFYENPRDRMGTLSGTPLRQLARPDAFVRGFGQHFTEKRTLPKDTPTGVLSGFPSEIPTPNIFE